jgi:ComF family protein
MPLCGSCIVAPPDVDQALAAVHYAYPWSGLVVRFKFQQHTGWAAFFASLLRSTPWVEPALEAADWVVPMPLSPERLRNRGFNQSQLLAQALEPAKLQTQLLLRIRETRPQSSLPQNERQRNVQGVYAVDPLKAHLVRAKRIVLVDDVMTSGASLNAAAKTLRQAGAAHITGLVFARTSW